MLLEQTMEQLRELKLYGVIAALEQQINTSLLVSNYLSSQYL